MEAGLHPDPLSRRSLAAVGDGRQGREEIGDGKGAKGILWKVEMGRINTAHRCSLSPLWGEWWKTSKSSKSPLTKLNTAPCASRNAGCNKISNSKRKHYKNLMTFSWIGSLAEYVSQTTQTGSTLPLVQFLKFTLVLTQLTQKLHFLSFPRFTLSPQSPVKQFITMRQNPPRNYFVKHVQNKRDDDTKAADMNRQYLNRWTFCAPPVQHSPAGLIKTKAIWEWQNH